MSMHLVKQNRGFQLFFHATSQAYYVYKDGKYLIGPKYNYNDVKTYVASPSPNQQNHT